jgi:magnesium-transporting ATPase (P-type)
VALLWRFLAVLALLLAGAAAVLPVLPALPFLLLAAAAAARGWPWLANRLRSHAALGPAITAWQRRGALPRAARGMTPASTQPSARLGLDSQEALARLRHFGPNRIEDARRGGIFDTLRGVLAEPMFLLLIVAAGLYLALGDLGEGLLLGFFALVTVGLVIFQERRSARALRALRALAVPQVQVLRDGRVVRIPSTDLVPGDWFLIDEGERIAADGVLREATGVSVDESLLTGESVPVRKIALADGMPNDEQRQAGDDRPVVLAGTLVTTGHGLAEVLATGVRTRMGRIGEMDRVGTTPAGK